MAFATGFLADQNKTGAGEVYGNNHVIIAREEFQDGLKVGRFAKFDNDQIENMSGSATPVIAGVVMRNITNVVEDLATIDASMFEQINLCSQGLITVAAKAGETPTFLAKVFASNAGNANDGLAMVDSTGIDTNAVYIETIKENVWLVNVNPQPGDFVAFNELADPGDGEEIAATRSYTTVALTTGGAETRDLLDPSFPGQQIALTLDVDGGNCVITAESAINQAGNNTLTFDDDGETIVLIAVQVGGEPVWRVLANDGVGLTTVSP